MSRAEAATAAKPVNLTEYIVEDLKNRINSGDLGSADLSLLALATHYKVSITPLRNAINELVEEGLITKLPNRRLQVNVGRARKSEPRKVASAPTSPRDWDAILLREVVHASLSIGSSYLREDGLSKKLGVGRSIIRQALSRFAGAGLIDHIPRRGWFVHPLGIEDMRAYLVVREMLEIKALKLARPSLDRVELQKLRDQTAKNRKRRHAPLDSGIHDYLIEKSGNRYIRQFFQQYIARYYTELFYFAAPETAVVTVMADEHLGVTDALLRRAWAEAERLLSQHIKGQSAVLLKLLEKERIEHGPKKSLAKRA
ncbi:MAG: GntR family transcriptional regulator [Spirochaetota bacterium]